jgi:hypothetical protein
MEWTAPTNTGGQAITGYKLTHNTGVGANPMTIAAGTTEQLFEGLTPGTTYTFSVVATNSIGDSVSSSVVSAYT